VREDDDGERSLYGLSYLVDRYWRGLAEASQSGGSSSESMGGKTMRRKRGHYRHWHREIRRRRGRKTLYGSRAVC